LTTAGAAAYQIGEAGTNWYNQHAFRGKVDYAFNEKALVSIQYIRQLSAYGYDAPLIFPRCGGKRNGSRASHVPGSGRAAAW
jgi:hypothetical protein